MTSEVLICNRALQMLGSDSIISLTEDNRRARAMSLAYGPTRDAELRRRKWRFSLRRAQIAADKAAPIHGFSYAYQIPNDCLRLLSGGDLRSLPDTSDYRSGQNEMYSLEGRKILTNLGAPLSIRYIARIEDPSMFDAAFAESLAARLALECCEQITQSDSKIQICMARYKESLREAKLSNALEGSSQSVADDTWVTARLG